MPGGPRHLNRVQRLQLAFDIAEQIHRHYQDDVTAIGIFGAVARGEDGAFSDIKLHCILQGSGFETMHKWSAGPWKAEVNVCTEEQALDRAAAVDVDWSWTHVAYTRVLAVYDPRDFFSRLRVTALSQPDSAFQHAILDVIVGEIFERVGNVRNAVAENDPAGLCLVVVELAKFGACLIGLANRHQYSSTCAALKESLSLPGLPAGYERLCGLVIAGALGDPVSIAKASDDFWMGVEMWASERGLEIDRQLSTLLDLAPKPERRQTKLDRAIAHVQSNGTQLDRLRLRNALGDPITLVEAEAAVAPYQSPDGSFSHQAFADSVERRGSLGGTLNFLRWLRELGLHGRSQMVRTLDFLATTQDVDGSFFEPQLTLALSPQDWLGRDRLTDRFFFTAAVPMRLYSLGYAEHPMIQPALRWLRSCWSDWQLVTGTWYNLWALLCISRAPIGLSGSLFQQCYASALDWLPRIPARPLTWLLDGLQGAGFSLDEPLVSVALDRLTSLQDDDGVWYDQSASTETTVTALSIFRRYDAPMALNPSS